MSTTERTGSAAGLDQGMVRATPGRMVIGMASVAMFFLLCATYWHAIRDMYMNWRLADSYYSHGFLVAPISIYLVWAKRGALASAVPMPSALGYPVVLASGLMLLVGDFLGFAVIQQVSLVPMIFGVSLLVFGREMTRIVWFPIVFLLMMVPIPSSITQNVVFDLKIVAAEAAVVLGRLSTLPMVREGSYIYFKNDSLLVGNVCGGLRSLIALFSVGLLMANISRTRPWARVAVIALSIPIAVAANVIRIFALCLVGYFWGSGVAGGVFHDVSGILIFVVAFGLFFALESVLRRFGSGDELQEEARPA